MLERQADFVKSFELELESTIPGKPKESPELLNLRKIEEQLANKAEYIEAHKVQQRRLIVERNEQEKWEVERRSRINKQMDQLKTRQKVELKALEQKIESGKEEQRKMRAIELEQ